MSKYEEKKFTVSTISTVSSIRKKKKGIENNASPVALSVRSGDAKARSEDNVLLTAPFALVRMRTSRIAIINAQITLSAKISVSINDEYIELRNIGVKPSSVLSATPDMIYQTAPNTKNINNGNKRFEITFIFKVIKIRI